MNEGARSTRVAVVVACLLLTTIALGCPGGERVVSTSSPLMAAQALGIPAPPEALNDSSPVTDFIRYGDSLLFATDSPGTITISRPVLGGGTSHLRIRSELRLPNTEVSDYSRGRIIAKFETVGGPSQFGAPVGNAYLWVRDTGGGNYRSVLMFRDYITSDTGRAIVGQQMHSTRRNSTMVSQCVDLTYESDTTRACCLCGSGEYNCMSVFAMTPGRLDELLTRAGKPPISTRTSP